MTANVNIKRGDLHLAVSTAFNRGRYVLMTGGDGQPQEITIDLRERPDDLFDGEYDLRALDAQKRREADLHAVVPRREDIGVWRPFPTDPHEVVRDDHGPAIPAQDGEYRKDGIGYPEVYEFALQDCISGGDGFTLDTVRATDAPDLTAMNAADWVHVYDRVTRERRTLKRPEPDAVLTGLRDVAGDLRKPWAKGDWARCVVAVGPYAEGDLACVTDVDEAGRFLGFTGDGATLKMHKFTHYDGALTGVPERGLPVEPPFGCAALPPVGPLTSTEGLKPGDVLRMLDTSEGFDSIWIFDGIVEGISFAGELHLHMRDGTKGIAPAKDLAFVGRPDADGWMTWAGGENPVPGATVEARFATGGDFKGRADEFTWLHLETPPTGGDVVAFRIVDTQPAV